MVVVIVRSKLTPAPNPEAPVVASVTPTTEFVILPVPKTKVAACEERDVPRRKPKNGSATFFMGTGQTICGSTVFAISEEANFTV